jgi:hypothetical protein
LDIQAIVKELKRERDRLNTAIVALEGTDLLLTPPKASPAADVPAPRAKKKRRHLTPEGRKRISDMMRKRWAEKRKKASNGAK